MLLIYGTLMPVRLLEEIQLWKNQEKEHAAIVAQLVPSLEPAYVQVMSEWEQVFAKTEETARQWLHTIISNNGASNETMLQQIELLLKASIYQSEQFIQQLQYLKLHSEAVHSSPQATMMIAHFVRESYVFLSMVQGLAHASLAQVSGTTQLPQAPAMDVQQPMAHIHSAAQQAQPATSGAPAPRDAMAGIAVRIGSSGWTHAANAAQATAPQANGAARGDAAPSSSGAASPSTGGYYTARTSHSGASRPQAESAPVPIGGHKLPPLPYAYDALEPFIDENTMRIHHDKHHQSYVDGLNKTELSIAEARKTNNYEHIKALERDLTFNGAGHYLHTIFWDTMRPHAGGEPMGELRRQIDQDFSSYEAFKQHFSKAAEQVEGGGWAILVWSPRSRRLAILQAEKHQNLSQWDVIPLLPLDVWEHAYYLKHQNKRADYIQDWWHVVNWAAVNERYQKARQLTWKAY